MQDVVLVFSHSHLQAGLIARTLRSCSVYCLPVPFSTSVTQALSLRPRGVILCADSLDPNALDGLDPAIPEMGVPVLALGGAAAMLCRRYGGSFSAVCDGLASVTLGLSCEELFADITGGERILPSLSTLVLSDVLSPIATATERVIGFRHQTLPLYALQYPIERNDPDLAQLLYNFASRICCCGASWDEPFIIDRAVERIRSAVPEGSVLCAVSGGVDSAVCAKLAHMAVGSRLKCVFIDTGLFRQDEPARVVRTLTEEVGLEVTLVEAQDVFLRALSGVSSARDKERIATQLMTQVLLRELTPDVRAVIVGTNFDDTLMGEAPADAEPVRYPADVCEPVRELFKDEVRRLASALQMPQAITGRQPFPSSGLALRVLGCVSAERLQLLRRADMLFREEILSGGHERRLGQFFATLFDNPEQPGTFAVCLHSTQASRTSTLAARLPFDVMERTAEQIRMLDGVTRVVYDLTPGLPSAEDASI